MGVRRRFTSVLLAMAIPVPTALGSGTFEGPIWTVSGSTEEELLGQFVATAGDINGDGFDDIVVANRASLSATAYVFLGSMGGPSAVPPISVPPGATQRPPHRS